MKKSPRLSFCSQSPGLDGAVRSHLITSARNEEGWDTFSLFARQRSTSVFQDSQLLFSCQQQPPYPPIILESLDLHDLPRYRKSLGPKRVDDDERRDARITSSETGHVPPASSNGVSGSTASFLRRAWTMG